jgi:hypothetical protein
MVVLLPLLLLLLPPHLAVAVAMDSSQHDPGKHTAETPILEQPATASFPLPPS